MKTCLLFLFFANSFVTKNVTTSGVSFPIVLSKNNIGFVLNGTGVKSRWFLDLYVAALYLPHKSKDDSYIVNCDCPFVLKIVVTSSWVSAKNFKNSVDYYFNESLNGKIGPLQDKIELFKKSFGNEININDEIDLVYHPNIGLKTYINGVYKNTISGLEFKRELAKLWLGDKPLDLNLKNGLLGLQ